MSQFQYEFRGAHHAMYAIGTVINLTKDAIIISGFCSVLVLDIKNVFNSSKWNRIKGALTGHFVNLVKNYQLDEGRNDNISRAGCARLNTDILACSSHLTGGFADCLVVVVIAVEVYWLKRAGLTLDDQKTLKLKT